MKSGNPANCRVRRLAVLLIFVMTAVTVLLPLGARAQGTGKTVRVGWYESAFHRTDPFGRKSGYGYEYQQRIATFTGWNYEYVEGSWSELLDMLIAGEIDLLSDVSYTEERAEKILYSAQEMGSEDFHAFITPNNTEIRPDDFSTFNGKLVGVNKNSIQAQLFRQWAEDHGVTPEIVELTGKTPELLDMLANGEIDVLVTLDAYGKTADVVPVCKIGSAQSYFGINRDRPDLKQELDVAMNRITEDNRYFNQQLAEKYESGQGITGFLTAEELDWYTGHGAIRVGYRDGFLPFCDIDRETGTLTGALSDFLSFAETCEKNAALSFEPRVFDTTRVALEALTAGEVDCVFPVNLTAYDGETEGVIITDSFVQAEVYAGVRTSDHHGVSPEQEMTVAVVSGNLNYNTFLMDYFPNWHAVYYDDNEAGFRAVADGEADCVLVNSYRLNRASELFEKYKLTTLSTGQSIDLAFAVRRGDDCLYSILNKVIQLMPDDTINSSLTNHAFPDDQVTFGAFLRDNLVSVLAVAVAVAALIVALLVRSIREEKSAREKKQLISAVERDEISGLYSKNFFFEYANRFRREQPETPTDTIELNIEQFHSINELNGRDFGDQALHLLGEEILSFTERTRVIASRIEADRFGIFCEPQADYQALLDRFQRRLNEMSGNANLRLRMGVMPWQKDLEPVQLYDRAHTACSMVRGSGRRLMIFDEAMRKREELDRRLVNDLGRAIRQRELAVYYQPKYDIQSEPPRLSSAEALVRWQHPELGLVSPEDFVPLFERNGQIQEIDRYVWTEAARQVADWRDRLGVTMPVSVNLSRVDVLDPGLEGILDGLVTEFGLERSHLKLEVTESAYIENAEQLSRIIRRLREKGYEIEMDDFGSGYSSLNMLSSMPIDVLKMDRAFIRNIEFSEKDARLVELILDIARNLQVPVIAEGVETENQLTMLKRAGCALVQGFYFSGPLPADEFEAEILR